MVWNPDMLTDKKINQLTPKETQYKVADRDGLNLLVYPTGKKTFKFNYRYNNRQETLTIGSYGEITLAQARQELMQARSLLAQGISPARKNRQRRGSLKTIPSGPGSSVMSRTLKSRIRLPRCASTQFKITWLRR